MRSIYRGKKYLSKLAHLCKLIFPPIAEWFPLQNKLNTMGVTILSSVGVNWERSAPLEFSIAYAIKWPGLPLHKTKPRALKFPHVLLVCVDLKKRHIELHINTNYLTKGSILEQQLFRFGNFFTAPISRICDTFSFTTMSDWFRLFCEPWCGAISIEERLRSLGRHDPSGLLRVLNMI